MTVREIHRKVRTQFQSVAAQTLDNFLPEEIDHYVNRATRKFINKTRPQVRSERSTPQGEEVHDNLRTLIDVHRYGETQVNSISDIDKGHTIDLGFAPSYEYFIAGRLYGDNYISNCRKVTTDRFFEHASTTYNQPLFRRVPITEKNGQLMLLRANDMETQPNGFMLTYLREFDSFSSTLEVEILINSTGTNLDVGPYTYQVNGVQDFVDAHGKELYNSLGIIASKEGPDTIGLTGKNSSVEAIDIQPSTSSALDKTLLGEPTGLDLPTDVHQRIVNMTVALLKRDLPQASQDQSSQQNSSEE